MGAMTNEPERVPDQATAHGPLATVHAAMAPTATIAAFGDVAAKQRQVAIEAAANPESGDVAEQRADLHREAAITDAMRADRAAHATP